MKHKTPSPAVLRSCTEATRAAAAHAQESAKWADVAQTAANASHVNELSAKRYAEQAEIRCRLWTADMKSAFSRVRVLAVFAYVLASVAFALSIIALAA